MITTFILAASAQAMTPAPLPKVDGRRIQAGTACYTIERDGSPMGTTFQSIQPTRSGRLPAWRIVIHQRLGGGRFELRDEFIVRRSDLRPISLDSRRGTRTSPGGWHEINVKYAAGRITGTRAQPDGVGAIDVALTGPVWEGNLWGVTFAALPLRNGGRYRLPFWQYDKGFGTFLVNVTGSEIVSTPAGRADAWVVEAGDDPNHLVRYLIAKRGGAELGYGSAGMRQRVGGDCRAMG
jgi:hypothetical protein